MIIRRRLSQNVRRCANRHRAQVKVGESALIMGSQTLYMRIISYQGLGSFRRCRQCRCCAGFICLKPYADRKLPHPWLETARGGDSVRPDRVFALLRFTTDDNMI